MENPGDSIEHLLSIVRNGEKPDRQNDLVVFRGSRRARDNPRIPFRNFRGVYPEGRATKPGEPDWWQATFLPVSSGRKTTPPRKYRDEVVELRLWNSEKSPVSG